MPEAPPQRSLARFLTETLATAGVKYLFGIPGGGSSLDVIASGADCGLDFILTGTETAGGIMAAVTGELTDAPGVLLTGIGPGAASAVNAAAYASLEKAPLLVLSDARTPAPGTSSHQVFDQKALYAPLVRMSRRLQAVDASRTGVGRRRRRSARLSGAARGSQRLMYPVKQSVTYRRLADPGWIVR